MSFPESHTPQKSILGHSASLGLWMGLYLFLMSAALIGSVRFQPIILLIFPLAAGTPVVLYFLLRKAWKQDPRLHSLSAVWLAGIWTFIFGSLICGILSAAWILLLEPDFVNTYITQSIQAIESTPMASQYTVEVQRLRSLQEAGAIPSPMQFVFTMIWTTAFLGSVVSLLVALIFRAKEYRTPFDRKL